MHHVDPIGPTDAKPVAIVSRLAQGEPASMETTFLIHEPDHAVTGAISHVGGPV